MLRAPPLSMLLAKIPLSAGSLLDVGWRSAELTLAYHQTNPNARLYGMRGEPARADAATAHLQEFVVADLEADPIPFPAPDGIDCILYYDQLHRLRDPWELVRRQAASLSADGTMVFSVPNADYWRWTDLRLRGQHESLPDWLYHAHARWMTIPGVLDQVRRAGLVPYDISGWAPDADDASQFIENLAAGLPPLGISDEDFRARAAPAQLICRARKVPARPLAVHGNMLPPVGGVSHVRVLHPLEAIAREAGVQTAVTDLFSPRRGDPETPRIFVLHRPALAGPQGAGLLRKLADEGYLIVSEFDDHPDHFPMMHRGGAIGFLGVHAVQTTTAVLGDVFRGYNPEIAVFPNAVTSLPAIGNFTDPDSLTLFFGALNREPDCAPYLPVLNAVAAAVGARLKFQVVHDRHFFEALQTPHKTFTPTADYETYVRLLGGSELCFMPLRDTAFSRAKSDLKFIEASACRVASIATTVVYGDSIEDGRTGLLFRDPAEFQVQLMRLVAQPGLAKELADAARRYVTAERMLAYQVAPRVAWYHSLWNRRHMLEAARQARIAAFVQG